jgi:uncharacterized protein (TIGR00288 family)
MTSSAGTAEVRRRARRYPTTNASTRARTIRAGSSSTRSTASTTATSRASKWCGSITRIAAAAPGRAAAGAAGHRAKRVAALSAASRRDMVTYHGAMTTPADTKNMAVFCDFENVALGVREAKYDKFDIGKVLERLLLKGSIVVKKAYCDWDRYKDFKAAMHQASFEMIEIPHVRMSGKNSADIRMVVDALDLCYTKSHVDTFVIVSGDSDFSPLVSKLRENDKTVIGVGVKKSTSDLLIANCDEFIYYDDLVREQKTRKPARRKAAPKNSPSPLGEGRGEGPSSEDADKKQEALDLVLETVEALADERGEDEPIWGSMVKQALKRRKPGFNETYYGFRSFNQLLEEARARNLLQLERDEKSGGYLVRAVE